MGLFDAFRKKPPAAPAEAPGGLLLAPTATPDTVARDLDTARALLHALGRT